MSSTIDGVRAKLNRTKKHLEVLHSEVLAHLKSCKQSIGVDLSDDETEMIVHFSVTPKPPPTIGVIVGECVHNLRSALDHIACQLWRNAGHRDCAGISFPLTTNPAAYAKVRDKLDGVIHKKALTLIDGLQPCAPSGIFQDPTYHPFAILKTLSNTDKHRTLNFAVTHSHNTMLQFMSDDGVVVSSLNIPASMKDDTYLKIVVPAGLVKPGMNVRVSGAGYIAFKERDGWGRKGIESVLSETLEFIEVIVVPRFEPFLG